MANNTPRVQRAVYFLSDGTPLLDAIEARGLKAQTVYSRIRRGASPDAAVGAVQRPAGRRPRLFTADGAALCSKLGAASVGPRAVYHRISRGLSPDDALR